MMNDQNSGALIELVGSNAETLSRDIGSLVLVNGVVVGPHQVRVIMPNLGEKSGRHRRVIG